MTFRSSFSPPGSPLHVAPPPYATTYPPQTAPDPHEWDRAAVHFEEAVRLINQRIAPRTIFKTVEHSWMLVGPDGDATTFATFGQAFNAALDLLKEDKPHEQP